MALSMLQFLPDAYESRFTVCNYDDPFDMPNAEGLNWMEFFMPFLMQSGAFEGTGMEWKQGGGYAGGRRSLDEVIDDIGSNDAKKKAMKQMLADRGVDTTKAYGSTSGQTQEMFSWIRNMDKHLEEDGGLSRGDRQYGTVDKWADYISQYSDVWGEAPKSPGEFVQTGKSDLSMFKDIWEWKRKNPDKEITKEKYDQSTWGEMGYGTAEFEKIQELASSSDFEQYGQIMDIAELQLETQKKSLENYGAAQERVNAPGYAKSAAEAAFAPARQEMEKFWSPGGEAGQMVGQGESAAGRVGDVRQSAELARRAGESREKLGAQESQYRGQIQQMVDVGNPMEALRMGQAVGPQSFQYTQQPMAQMMAPMQQMFPMSAQSYQQQLLPYQYAQGVPQGPSGMDYGMAGVSMGVNALRGISMMTPYGAAANAGYELGNTLYGTYG